MLGRIERFKKLPWYSKTGLVLLSPFLLSMWCVMWGLDYLADLMDALEQIMEETHDN